MRVCRSANGWLENRFQGGVEKNKYEIPKKNKPLEYSNPNKRIVVWSDIIILYRTGGGTLRALYRI